jgi:hypothetical protein
VRTSVVPFHARRRWQAHQVLVAADSMLQSLPRGVIAFRIDVADWTKFRQLFRGWLSGRVDSAIHDLRASSNCIRRFIAAPRAYCSVPRTLRSAGTVSIESVCAESHSSAASSVGLHYRVDSSVAHEMIAKI